MNTYMKGLVGGKIVDAGSGDSYDDFPYFIVQHPKYGKLKVEVSQDPEGNGPGFLFGLPDVRSTRGPKEEPGITPDSFESTLDQAVNSLTE
jgi:hypothetical protein